MPWKRRERKACQLYNEDGNKMNWGYTEKEEEGIKRVKGVKSRLRRFNGYMMRILCDKWK